jgi:hypothetical protein
VNNELEIMMSVFLYGCETWSLTLKREHSVSENRVQRRIFGPKRDEVTTRASELVLFAKYNKNDQVKVDEMGSACSMN